MKSRVGGNTTLGTMRVTRCLVGRGGVKWLGGDVGGDHLEDGFSSNFFFGVWAARGKCRR